METTNQRNRREIAEQLNDYIKQGGKINKLKTSNYTPPRCYPMRNIGTYAEEYTPASMRDRGLN